METYRIRRVLLLIILRITNIYAYLSAGSYQLLDDYEVSLEGTNYLMFEVSACQNAHLLLMEDSHDFDQHVYEIVIGGGSNTKLVIRKGRLGNQLAEAETEPLHCNSLQGFWISWAEDVLTLGSGHSLGTYQLLLFNETDTWEIKHLSVSGGDSWIFYHNNCGHCTADQSFPQRMICQGLKFSGFTGSTVYTISGQDNYNITEVYCDMITDNGGWLVFQRRQDGSENFYRGWTDYENGFGNLSGEFWLGNQKLSRILEFGHFELRIDLEDFEGNRRYAKYDNFKIGNHFDNYTLTVSGYSGDAGDCLAYHNGMQFSTYDAENDINDQVECAILYDGAWWYSACHESNLNGLYLQGNHSSSSNGVNWKTWRGYNYSLKMTEMKIRCN